MDKNFYISQLKEKVAINNENIDFFVALRLLLAYNRRMIDKESLPKFDEQVKNEYFSIIKESTNADNAREKVLALCDEDVKKAYLLGKNQEDSLFNVHTLVTGCEDTLEKGFVKEARWLGDYSLENQDMLDDFKRAVVNYDIYSKIYNDDASFHAFYLKAKSKDSKGVLTEEIYKHRLEKLLDDVCATKCAIEDKYIPRVVEELVRDDVRISSKQDLEKK